MFYIEEEKRGLCAEENHAISGRYEIEIKPNELKEITFVASLEENIEELDGKKVISKDYEKISFIYLHIALCKRAFSSNRIYSRKFEIQRNFFKSTESFCR